MGFICLRKLDPRVQWRNPVMLVVCVGRRLPTHLSAQPDRVVTHQQLLKAVWGPGHAGDTHCVRLHMANLRKKIENAPSMPKHLLTEAGIGYRFPP